MGEVQPLNPFGDLGRFFDFMYDNSEGYVYTATKDFESGEFQQYFFQWPTEREALIQHVFTHSDYREVYYGPALYSKKESTKEALLGSSFLWCEFDGNAPETVSGLPSPSLRIQSSAERNQHWYWKLESFEKDTSTLEELNQRIAYELNADFSGWDATQLLRPPGTRHHESGRLTGVVRWDPRPLPIAEFKGLPEVPIKFVQTEDIKDVPQPLRVISKYVFSDEEMDFFLTPTIEKGHRSSALTKLAHICLEDPKRMTNAECLSLLLHADQRWGKFSKRKDRVDRLIGIINYCRTRHPVNLVKEETTEPKLKIYTYDEFVNTELKIEWVIPGLIHKEAFVVVHGPPGSGKSQLSLRFAEKLAKGEPFLKWKPDRPLRTITLSLEMSFTELRLFIDTMEFGANPLLRENMLLAPSGEAVKLISAEGQASVIEAIEAYRPDGIIIDSLGASISDDSQSEKIVYKLINFVNQVRKHYGIFIWFIAHPRKDQIGNKKPTGLSDIYGSYAIGQHLTTGISLWNPPKLGNVIEVMNSKLRLAEEFKPFKIRRTPTLDFEMILGQRTLPSDTPIFGGDDEGDDDMDFGGLKI